MVLVVDRAKGDLFVVPVEPGELGGRLSFGHTRQVGDAGNEAEEFAPLLCRPFWFVWVENT